MAQWARTLTGDMLLPTIGSGQSAIVTDPATCAKIKIPSVFQFVKGEWVLDQNLGFPWPTVWSQKNPNLFVLKQLFRKTLLGITVGMPPVVAITDLAMAYASAIRDLKYSTAVRLATGQNVTVP
jgi:hypothetical protein